MENNSQNLEEIKSLEKNYTDQQNFFLEKITKNLKEYLKYSDITLETLKQIKTKFETNTQLTITEFELLGSLCYMIGIDYVNQPYLKKDVFERVHKRFEFFNFNKDIIKAFANIFDSSDYIKENVLQPAIEDFKNQLLLNVVIKNEDKLHFLNLKNAVNSILKNSTLPVNMSVASYKFLLKDIYTHEDIIKLNSLINRQCKFLGSSASKNVLKLYSNSLWTELLDNATKLFDSQKFGVVYLDSILSTSEACKKFGVSLNVVLSGDFSSIDFEKIEYDFEKNKIGLKDNDPDTKDDKIPSKEEIKDLGENYPVLFIMGMLDDLFKETPSEDKNKTDQLLHSINVLIGEKDYAQHIYHYLKVNTDKVKAEDIEQYEDYENLNIVEILAKINANIDEKKSLYKEKVEAVCQPIPDVYSNRVKEYIVACIKSLILSTDDQKQYLISQLIEPEIETYQHLQQILTLIESCDILGSELNTYFQLNQYLNENTNIIDVFKNVEVIDSLQMELSMYGALGKFFAKLLIVEDPEKNK